MSRLEHSLRTAVALGAAAVVGAITGMTGDVPPARAHPSGPPFSVSQYEGLAFTPERVVVTAVVHTAELATAQDRRAVDADHDGTVTDAERSRHARLACAQLADGFEVDVDGARLAWSVEPGQYRYDTSAAGLASAWLRCTLSAPATFSGPATVTIANHYRVDRPGWREITAVAAGVHLPGSPVPERSVSDELRAIPPADALVLDVKTATVQVRPGAAPLDPSPLDDPNRATVTAGSTQAQHRLEAPTTPPLALLLVLAALLVAIVVGAAYAVPRGPRTRRPPDAP